MAKIIAVCGKICSGKTYYANGLKEKGKAVILSCDELTKALFDNHLGEKHDEMSARIQAYFLRKSMEIVSAGCDVILDWGFWTRAGRERLGAFCEAHHVPCEWHYIDVGDEIWLRSIDERNRLISQGNGGMDYYLDEGLMNKLMSLWEVPEKEDMDVIVERR